MYICLNDEIMTTTIIRIDISKIDEEIVEHEKQIAKLQADIEFKKNLKNYAISNGIANVNIRSKANSNDAPADGISYFITSYLKANGKSDTTDIRKAYADSVSKKSDDVKNNVANALSRLKIAGKVNNELNGKGKKAGSKWHLLDKK